MSTPAERLKFARKRRFSKSARAAAIDNGWPESTVRSHESGSRGFDEEWARAYGAAYGVDWKWLLYNEGKPAGKVPREIEVSASLPPDEVQHVVRVGGRRRYFTSQHGYLTGDPQDPADLVGKECVLTLPDGQMIVRKIQRRVGRDTFDLVGPTGEVSKAQKIKTAEPIQLRTD